MLRISISARPRQQGGAGRALALALAGSALLGFGAIAAPAAAQEEQQQAGNSEGFAKAYEPVAAIANAEGGGARVTIVFPFRATGMKPAVAA